MLLADGDSVNIRVKKQIAMDAFVSTSGRYRCFLAEAYRPDTRFGGFATLRWYEIVFMRSDGQNFKKELGGELRPAREKWEEIKALMTAPFQGKEEPVDNWQVMTYSNHKFTQKEADMLKIRPIGARVFIREIFPVDEVTVRAEAAGLAMALDPSNQPPATMGLVIRVGSDPFIQELCRPGDVISYGKHDGSTFMENGQVYRDIGVHEIRGVRTPEDGYEDLNLTDKRNEAVVSDMKEITQTQSSQPDLPNPEPVVALDTGTPSQIPADTP